VAEDKDNGSSRSYLSEEVRSQRVDIVDLVKAVAGLQVVVKELVEDAKEERKSSKEYRDYIRDQLYAQRSEQQQLQMSLTAVQANVAGISATLKQHEEERMRAKGAIGFALNSARVGWAIFGGIVVGWVVWMLKLGK
jgi:flagellar motility protein MotE (MotC chaperone)